MTKAEYVVLRQAVFLKNANSKEIKAIDYVFTANDFYVYENYDDDNFKVVKRFTLKAIKGK